MRASYQRVQQWAERRLPALTRHRRPETLPIDLHRRRVYILPTGFGVAFTLLLLVMMVGSLNYSNNAALLLTCLLGAATCISMLIAFRTLNGLRLRGLRAGHATAGQPVDITFDFEARRLRQAVRLDIAQSSRAFDVHGRTDVTLSIPTERRGWLSVPRFCIWTTWPMGLFRAWSWMHPEQAVLVWPQPEHSGPAPALPVEDSHRQRLHRGEDLAALRDYRSGDSIRHVAWKASARHENLLVKDYEQPEARQEWCLDWRQLKGLSDEARIARLARWLGEAQAQGRHWSLWLPGEAIELGSGPSHYARCMTALALLP
ncbi:DUF58 domain-containing protein [Dyella mobilis]|uniref:DUF58 domain-containing protein n=1 Tax=Dyella mobilis TaxID=1849582 RepID=A0ABS2KIV7_9GAMM|nr:DUF58 domain-containing protein [Dyella mobilis]MBM7130843.1 DUF58 domain-containing protein [Dyella mobilis]GLQ97471.1 membrane protein [Dyella mobilis]